MKRGQLAMKHVPALALAAPAFAQVQTVGDVSFAVPEGWTYQGAADGGYMMLKQSTNFWIVSVHPPRPTSGARTSTTGASPHGLCYFPQPGNISLGHNGVYH